MGVTSIRLNPDIENPLQELADKLDRSKNYLINQAVKEFLIKEAMEDQRWKDTLQALESVKAGKVVNEKEVTDWLKSWGAKDEGDAPKA